MNSLRKIAFIWKNLQVLRVCRICFVLYQKSVGCGEFIRKTKIQSGFKINTEQEKQIAGYDIFIMIEFI